VISRGTATFVEDELTWSAGADVVDGGGAELGGERDGRADFAESVESRE
jgi:hypothetical protein